MAALQIVGPVLLDRALDLGRGVIGLNIGEQIDRVQADKPLQMFERKDRGLFNQLDLCVVPVSGSHAAIARDERRCESFGERHIRGVVGRETVAQ